MKNINEKYTILYVDDEESNLNIFKNTFRREYKILVANSASKGLEILKNEHVDLILTDQRMPEMSGVEFLKHTLLRYPNLNRILITAYSDFDALRNAINEAQIFQYIQKPWTEENLRHIIDQALEVYKVKKENEELNRRIAEKNQQLEAINKELVDFEKLKSDFLATISHEIRTPLNGLKGPISLLKQEMKSDDTDQIEVLFYILEHSVNRLEQFILTAERITWLKARKYKLELESFSVKEIFDSASAFYNTRILEKNIVLNLNVEKTIEICADKELMKICLNILLDNAIKYSANKGKIKLTANKSENKVMITVSDCGTGFSEEVLKHIFKLFTKNKEFVDQNPGLDLALVKLIVDVHNGTIEARNNPGSGATVKITIPECK